MTKPRQITLADARRLWLHAQRLDVPEPFGKGPEATRAAIAHLGYVQIDTINVIERSHHHILYSRIPAYRRADLQHAQSVDKTVFEYWTHALSYVAVADLPYFIPAMKDVAASPKSWYEGVDPKDVAKLAQQIRRDGALSIRDIDDDPVEKTHLWASRKPSKRVLELGFYAGVFAIAERAGMVKTYELMERHFGWPPRPRGATPGQIRDYQLDRALRAQGLISAASVMHPKLTFPAEMQAIVDRRVRAQKLVPVSIEGDKTAYYATPAALDEPAVEAAPYVHILSPFDPLIIQRRRLNLLFGYDHVFEAYVPKAKRVFGYFTLPVLIGDEIVAALDLKADRAAGKLLIQAWHWLPPARKREHKPMIETALERFGKFQFGD